ncbi:sarcosine oxidase subunit gamma [Pseudosulfitobacter sp. DSM 107133]|uniref:sarcosine oxidase subunit gamma n=1 Tax=Pseudosulfitobacter sp. DSM 107133 TaxID=2883100 RepID=UPI000DF410BB|nr:sarcosine oxidase subunit gamma [Pseudosulfitobacter sp. DSM 107133]UOA29223.1 Sarcosine oxidase subunit gamma [Pseudosulfitobacter sp. DSM 107133]
MNAPVSVFTPAVLVETAAARVSTATPCARLALRARGDLTPFDTALGLSLPTRIGQRAQSDGIEAICLGPDEWMLQTAEADAGAIINACAALYDRQPHSLVDVSGREVTFEIEGPLAAKLLTLGCPRDIGKIAIGEGRRTLFDGATIVLWCDAQDRFRMDVWNSFAAHVFSLLETGCRELAAETL